MHKKLFIVNCLISVLVVGGFFWVNTLSFSTEHASTDISGILTSGTTWTTR